MALRPMDVPAETLAWLVSGKTATRNFMEQIALDHGGLLQQLLPDAAIPHVDAIRCQPLTGRLLAGGNALLSTRGVAGIQEAVNWESDTGRAWGAMAVGMAPGWTFKKRLEEIRPFASDEHFAVREWAWISLREYVISEPLLAIAALEPWSYEACHRLRRFASEITRPRGVWCRHHPLLRKSPEHATALLEPLRDDETDYVRRSVGNWLNDASKSRPDWVRQTCDRWAKDLPATRTLEVRRRALRTIGPHQ